MYFSSIMIYSLTTKRLKKAGFGKDSIIMGLKSGLGIIQNGTWPPAAMCGI
jgi:hypothetical protein